MIDTEIEHLSPEEQQVLEAGSLAAVAFPAWMVAAALGQELATTEEACDALARRVSFVKRAGEDELPDGTRSSFYVFGHALYRQVLYQRQSAGRRAARHVRVAARLRELFRGREEFIAREAATHYEAAGDWANAAAMLRIASRRAASMQAYGEAAELRERIARLDENALPAARNAVATDACEELMWSHDADIAELRGSKSAKA
jgi:predicted ATPase